jgi:hypothetical protein
MPVIGEPPHPRVLFVGFNPDDARLHAMLELVSFAKLVTEPVVGRRIRLADWDAIVALDSSPRVTRLDADHLYTLSFGQSVAARLRSGTEPVAAFYWADQPSPIMQIAEGLDDDVAELVRDDLVPWLQTQAVKPRLSHGSTAQNPFAVSTYNQPGVFVYDADGQIIAGDIQKYVVTEPNRAGSVWALPYLPPHPERWLRAALRNWHIRNPERFPRTADWRSRPTWQTPAETAANDLVATAQAAHAAALMKFAQEIADLKDQAQRASDEAAKRSRRLLTEQDDELVDAVKDALTFFGFTVQDVDRLIPEGQARKEDLRLSDPENPAWSNITEVKGYLAGGAKSRDLLKVIHYGGLYFRETGTEPVSLWYIVNHFGSRDPDDRPRVLTGADDEIAYFASLGGLIIDTRELFRLLKLVETGVLAAADARETLRTATGIYTAPDEKAPTTKRQ